jgi:Coenzyme PQQ synthesis protein D (PqqD)
MGSERLSLIRAQAVKRVAIPEAVLFRELDGEAVILATDSGKYFGLNDVGTRMWTLLRQHGEVEAACRALLEEYDVSEEFLREDFGRFIDLLAARGLVERV